MAQSQRQHAPRLVNVLKNDDDWSGLKDATERRKRQNRLNVRAYRKRKLQACSSVSIASTTTSAPTSSEDQFLQPHWDGAIQSITLRPRIPLSPKQPLLPMHILASDSITCVVFPLTSDHLITLIQFNFLRAGLTNRALLDTVSGLNSHLHAIAFKPTDLHVFPTLPSYYLPRSLLPTFIQRTIPHPHWIDIVPHPRLRDNLILAQGRFDAHELWSDTVGGLFEGFKDGEISGMLVWGEAWEWEGWELSERFAEKWAWALEGCGDVVEASRGWRAGRGVNI